MQIAYANWDVVFGTRLRKIMSYCALGCPMMNLRTELRLFQCPEWLDATPTYVWSVHPYREMD